MNHRASRRCVSRACWQWRYTVVATLALVALGVATAAADDRDLLRDSSNDAYVFILLDTSGSMNWTPQCTQAAFDAGECSVLCPTGECFAPRNGDDPASKFYQAKEALSEVIGNIEGVNFGFATYDQDELVVFNKHWLYHVSPVDHDGNSYPRLTLNSGYKYPPIGGEEVFGEDWNCDEGSGFDEAGCYGNSEAIADLNDSLELRRAQRLPKLDREMNASTTIYLRDSDSRRYEFIYRPLAELSPGVPNAYGNPILAVDVEVRLCANDRAFCRSDPVDRKTIYYELVGDFIPWSLRPKRNPPENSFFNYDESAAEDTCAGWDANSDTNDDRYPDSTGYSLRWPTDTSDTRDDPGGTQFDFGDVIPLDWNDTHVDDLLDRLAPDGSYSVATYFNDLRQGSDNFLRLKDETKRPLIPNGSTPLGNSIQNFRVWYSGCASSNCATPGWSTLATAQDPDWGCRKKYLLVVTDGDDTCFAENPCIQTKGLKDQAGVRTFVVAYGVQNTPTNSLNCMAANGGTGEPIYPQNKAELVAALTQIFNDIREEARAFASASVPTVQNETSDKIYLSSFTPIKDIAVWPGRIDAFRKPLPLKDDDTPDFGRDCDADRQASCHLWEAGEKLLEQAPTPSQADGAIYKYGNNSTTRRVLYATEPDPNDVTPEVPTPLRLFMPPRSSDTTARYDLWRGLGIIPPTTQTGTLSSSAESGAVSAARKIIGNSVKIKTEVVPDPDGITADQTFAYVMGDIFHADPVIINSPNHLRYFRQDLNDYQAFAEEHFWRRKMLVVAANDGQLHFFDAGIRTQVYDPTLGSYVERFTDGTGTELFAYMPRLVMPIVGDQFDGSPVSSASVAGAHIYSLDGVVSSADVYIDPLHSGTNQREEDRGWRTILVSGLREGGDIVGGGTVSGFTSGYFALDITQPDRLSTPSPSFPTPYPDPPGQLIPGCLFVDVTEGDQETRSGCNSPAGSAFPFPAELWTFTDRIGDPTTSSRDVFFLDEDDNAFPLNPTLGLAVTPDGNGFADLGDTWSKPVIGQIKVCAGSDCDPDVEPNDIESRFVAIFGGGVDTNSPNAPRRGNWLYMIDVETGQPIYKRQLLGSGAASPAVLDADQDGFFDVIYIPTTTGYLYKVDLTARDSFGDVPALEDVIINNSRLLGSPYGTFTSVTVERVIDPAWDPFPILSTGGRPVYMTPTIFYVSSLDQYAIAFGTGNRPNLWERNGVEGRFYTIVDEDYDRLDLTLPRTEANYELIPFDAGNRNDDLLANPPAGLNRGWVLQFDADERLITQPFVLVSVMVFTTFNPFQTVAAPDELCARTGESRVFVVDATNANAFTDLDDLSDTVERFLSIGDFTTSPYVDQTATKNPLTSGSDERNTETTLDPTQQALQDAIRDALKSYFPEGCKYNDSFSLTINASRSDTGVVRYATIPIAMCPVDWKGR